MYRAALMRAMHKAERRVQEMQYVQAMHEQRLKADVEHAKNLVLKAEQESDALLALVQEELQALPSASWMQRPGFRPFGMYLLPWRKR
jgi:hypothetical protein